MTMVRHRLAFLELFWDREKNQMVKHYFAKGKKNKKAKQVYNKLSQIDSYTKEYILK